jgi:hypothetical protein
MDGTDTALIRNWYGTDKCESTFIHAVVYLTRLILLQNIE